MSPFTPAPLSEEELGQTSGAPFISRQDLSDWLGKDVTADDGALIAIDAACDVCRTTAEQEFNQVTGDTITLDGTGTDCLLLPELPVTAAGTVLVNGGTVNDYALGSNGRLIRMSGTAGVIYGASPIWPMGRENVVVTYDHGYAGSALPRDVRMVALSLAARLVVQGVATQESLGDVSVTYAGPAMDLTKGEAAILRKYRPTR